MYVNDMRTRYTGVVVKVDYWAKQPGHDHVDVRLTRPGEFPDEKVGTIVSTYRCAVNESGPQECPDESWRRALP